MGIFDKLMGKKCGICHQKLVFSSKVGPSVNIGTGLKAMETLFSMRDHYASKCKQDGTLLCYKCATTYPCPKCGGKAFELALQD